MANTIESNQVFLVTKVLQSETVLKQFQFQNGNLAALIKTSNPESPARLSEFSFEANGNFQCEGTRKVTKDEFAALSAVTAGSVVDFNNVFGIEDTDDWTALVV